MLQNFQLPKCIGASSLEALCVEINTHKAEPWIMPGSIPENVDILTSVIPEEEKKKFDDLNDYVAVGKLAWGDAGGILVLGTLMITLVGVCIAGPGDGVGCDVMRRLPDSPLG